MNEKLVRDIPGQRIRAEGGNVRVASAHEMTSLLARKLVEEANEVVQAVVLWDAEQEPGKHRPQIVEELADAAEVIATLRRMFYISEEELEHAMQMKRADKGTFTHRLVWREP